MFNNIQARYTNLAKSRVSDTDGYKLPSHGNCDLDRKFELATVDQGKAWKTDQAQSTNYLSNMHEVF